MGKLTKKDALKIAGKLNASIDTSGKAHDIAFIYHAGREIASFGIRRGSGEHLGHGHISHDLHMGPHDTKSLAQCSISREQWIERLSEKGLI